MDASSVPKDPQFTRHGGDPRWRSLHPVSSHYSSIERPLLSLVPLLFLLYTTSLQLDPFVCFVGQPVVPFEKLLRWLSCSRQCQRKFIASCPGRLIDFLVRPFRPPYWRATKNLQPRRADRPRANFSSFCSYRRPSLVNPRGISVYCLTSSLA